MNEIINTIKDRPLKLLIGGSPCTYWAICQKKNRETEASGEGWELFKNYLIAKEKFNPDYFIYENNESASSKIKEQISLELGSPLLHINSALVSAQNRRRIYCTNMPNVSLPEDRGILLKDIIISGLVDRDKSYPLKHQGGNARDYLKKHHTQIAFEPVDIKFLSEKEMTYMLRETKDGRNHFDYGYFHTTSNDKSQCLLANTYKGVPYNIMCEKIDQNQNIVIDNQCIYCVKDKKITYKDNQYNINLPDGYYLIRKITPIECERLQTLPDNYTAWGINESGKEVKISDTQRFKQLGNGWTAELIIHLLSYIDIPKDYPIEVLSMYDGIGTGRYCLEKLGYTNIKYKSYETDKYAKSVAIRNYPDIAECGDAFQVREKDWKY